MSKQRDQENLNPHAEAIAAAVAAEREQCAQIADGARHYYSGVAIGADIAAAIRARGATKETVE